MRALLMICVLAACGGRAPAYPKLGTCVSPTTGWAFQTVPADAPPDWCDGPITKLGLIDMHPFNPSDPTYAAIVTATFQDLEHLDDKRTPNAYDTTCDHCPLVSGQAYLARLSKEGVLYSLLIDGVERIAGVRYEGALLTDPHLMNSRRLECDGTFQGDHSVMEGPAHWEMIDPDPAWQLSLPGKVATCVAGKEDRDWSLAGPSERVTLPACREHDPYANRTISVVITVSAESGSEWLYPEAPADVADAIMAAMNVNGSGLVFQPASGADPEIQVYVTVHEQNDGTAQNTAEASVFALGEGLQFQVNSGEHPYATWDEAIGALSTQLVSWFQNGWHQPAPCVKRDGTVLKD